jgi:hypothetical protein
MCAASRSKGAKFIGRSLVDPPLFVDAPLGK